MMSLTKPQTIFILRYRNFIHTLLLIDITLVYLIVTLEISLNDNPIALCRINHLITH